MDIAQHRHTLYEANRSHFCHLPARFVGRVCFSDAAGDDRTPVAFNNSSATNQNLIGSCQSLQKYIASYLQQVPHSQGGRTLFFAFHTHVSAAQEEEWGGGELAPKLWQSPNSCFHLIKIQN